MRDERGEVARALMFGSAVVRATPRHNDSAATWEERKWCKDTMDGWWGDRLTKKE